MSGLALVGSDVPDVRSHTPHLSHSRVDRYLTCPRSYELHYIERLRLRRQPANLVFGSTVHQALEGLFRDGTDPVATFDAVWADAKGLDLGYSGRATWESLQAIGTALVERFVKEHLGRIDRVEALEERFEVSVTGLSVPFLGFIDLKAHLDGTPTVIDFKTASSRYGDHEAELSDQLTAYGLVEPEVEQLALCVLVKTKKPQIQWLKARRTGDQLAEYFDKVTLVEQGILSGKFFKRTGAWCRWCDFLPVCSGDQFKAQATLVRIDASP